MPAHLKTVNLGRRLANVSKDGPAAANFRRLRSRIRRPDREDEIVGPVKPLAEATR